MEAEFFCLDAHEETVARLARLVAAHVDPSVALRLSNAESGGREGRASIGGRYARLLQASIPPERGLSLELVHWLELFGRRVYLRIYWPILVQGYQAVDDGTYYYSYVRTGEAHFFPRGLGLERFFPAVAIRDRMVLVPSGQNDVLAGVGPRAGAADPMARDVREVDFDDHDALDRAMAEIGGELRRELRQELTAYASFRDPGAFDLTDAAAHLGVTEGFARRALREEAEQATAVYQRLACTLEPDRIAHGRWTRVALRVHNDTDTELAGLTVQLTGPADVLPRRLETSLPARSTVSLTVSVRPADPGDFPLEVVFLQAGEQLLAGLLPLHHVWIQSVEGHG